MRLVLALLALAALASCTWEEVGNAVGGGAKSWCRNAPNCTVHPQG